MRCSTCGKMNCYAHGGSVYDEDKEKGVHPRSYSKQGGGVSDAGSTLRDNAGMKRGGYFDKSAAIKDEHKRVLGESRSLPKPKLKGLAHGGEVDMYEMDPDVPSMHGMKDGGEVDDMHGVDDELMDMACDELLQAIESKDKKQILESIKAIVLSCGE